MPRLRYVIAKTAKVWWIFGVIYTLMDVVYHFYINNHIQCIRAFLNGIIAVIGLIIISDIEKRQ